MSDRTDAIRSALADEWQTTSEIAEAAGYISCSRINPREAWVVLSSDAKFKLVEVKREGKKVYWRRRINGAGALEMDPRLEP